MLTQAPSCMACSLFATTNLAVIRHHAPDWDGKRKRTARRNGPSNRIADFVPIESQRPINDFRIVHGDCRQHHCSLAQRARWTGFGVRFPNRIVRGKLQRSPAANGTRVCYFFTPRTKRRTPASSYNERSNHFDRLIVVGFHLTSRWVHDVGGRPEGRPSLSDDTENILNPTKEAPFVRFLPVLSVVSLICDSYPLIACRV